MRRTKLFTFRVNQEEHKLISRLAKCMQRTQSDAVRFLIINAAQEITDQHNSYKKSIERNIKVNDTNVSK